MMQKVGIAMAILYIMIMKENNSGLVYEEHETYEAKSFIEKDLQTIVSFQWVTLSVMGYGLWVMGYGFITQN